MSATEEKSHIKRKRVEEEPSVVSPQVALSGRTRMIADNYMTVVGDLMYPKSTCVGFGQKAEEGKFPVNRVATLGYLMSPLRRPTVIEKWSPYEIALFEGGITLYGKNFNQIQKVVKSKKVKEIIEFYYEWKKTSHYKQWKQSYIPDERDTPTVLVES